jgi:DNA-binding NarL/FixJ family response regulator
MIRVVLADDVAVMRDLIADLLEASHEIEVVARAGDAPTLLERVAETVPDVVVTDVRMPPTGTDEGIRVAERLRETHPEIGVVVLTQYSEPALTARVFAGDAARRAWVLKERMNHDGQLVAAVKAIDAGASWVDPKAQADAAGR